jgi:hypothetical protein
MAKLFKTISLEERYNSSVHNELPAKVRAVNQGSILLQPAKPSKELESALLKTLPNAVEQNSAILKGMVKGPESIPPFVNTKFRSAISLADRLSQPKIGSTTHLAQYFLSDVNTDYIKITPFGIFNHTSTTVIQPVKTNIAQGGQNPIIFNPTLSQGLVYANGVASSFINISVLTYDSLLLQGTFFSNGVYQSFTNTILPLGVNQGPGTNPILAITVPFLAPLQGPGTNPVLALTNAAILATQGTINTNNIIKSVINVVRSRLSGTIPQKGNVVLGTPSTTVVQDGDIVLDTPTTTVVQDDNIILNVPKSIVQLEDYSTRWFDSATGQMVSQTDLGTPKGGIEFVQTRPVSALPKEEQSPQLNQITFEPKYTFPVLKSLRYAADRALASFSPTVKHGSSGIPTSVTKEGSTYFENAGILFGDYYLGGDVTKTITMSNMMRTEPQKPGESNGLTNYLTATRQFTSADLNNEFYKVNYDNLADNVKDPGLYINGRLLPLYKENIKDILDRGSRPFATQGGESKPSEYNTPPSPPTIGITQDLDPNGDISLGYYDTLLYKDLVARSNTSVKGRNGTDFRSLLREDGIVIKYIDDQPTDQYIEKYGSVEQRSPLNAVVGDDRKSDFVTLKIGPLGSSSPIVFRSYITNFSDSWTNTWEDTKLLNRLETIHSYRGVVRAGSIAFKVPALSSKDMDIIYGKLQSLVRVASIPKAPRTEGTMMKAPICSFTLGKWYINTPIAVNSVKYDIQMAEYAWDVDRQLPQIVDVSMDFRFIVGIGDGSAVPTAGLIPFA